MQPRLADMTVADRLVEKLIAAGVQHVFGVSGANIEDLFAAAQRRQTQLRVVLAKHEHGAATAASAYARVRGGLGVVMATSGGGAMNLVHALAEARASRVPLLALVGEPPTELQGAGAFQDTSGKGGVVDAVAVLEAAAGFCLRMRNAEEALHVFDRALAHIAAESQPAVLLIAKDLQQAQPGRRSERESLVPTPRMPRLSFPAVSAAARQVVEGPCVVIAGDEVLRARAQSELAQLVAALDATIAVTPDARDAYDNYDPRFLGVAGAMGQPRVVAALGSASCCLLVGTRLPLLARMGLEPRLLEMSIVSVGREEPFVRGRTHHHVECEIRSGLRALTSAVLNQVARPGHGPPMDPEPTPAADASFDSGAVLRALEPEIEAAGIVLVDAGNTGASAIHHLRAPREGRWLIAMGMAGMGYTFGAAIGAAFASERRCWVIAGDGAFFMHGLEIHTALEHSLPITYLIFDNSAHGMCLVRERLLMRTDGSYNSFRRSHIAAGVAAMFPGLVARECASLAELGDALHAVRRIAGPSVIVVRLERVEVPPFVAFQRAEPAAKTVSRGGTDASE